MEHFLCTVIWPGTPKVYCCLAEALGNEVTPYMYSDRKPLTDVLSLLACPSCCFTQFVARWVWQCLHSLTRVELWNHVDDTSSGLSYYPYRTAAGEMIYQLARSINIGGTAIFSFNSSSLMGQQNISQSFTTQNFIVLFLFSAGGSDAHVRPPECA